MSVIIIVNVIYSNTILALFHIPWVWIEKVNNDTFHEKRIRATHCEVVLVLFRVNRS
jgi:hypothetical protein